MATIITLVFTIALGAAMYVLYRKALPKPIPGIPYNSASAKSLLGDVPSLKADLARRGDLTLWLMDQNHKSQSAINQLFMKPFGRPVVILADARECRDIQTRRTKDFDRSSRIKDVFGPLINANHFTLKTGPQWAAHRRLIQDTVSFKFLHDIAAPTVYESALRFVDLWKTKSEIAQGRPFEATHDLFHITFDAVLAFTFGSEFPHSCIEPQANSLKALQKERLTFGLSKDDVVPFPKAQLDIELESMIRLVDYVSIVQSQPWPKLHWLYYLNTPSLNRFRRIKNEAIRKEIVKAAETRVRNQSQKDDSWVQSVVDHVIDRECKQANKENRQPNIFSPMITDEIYGIAVAGHETTSSSFCWAVKILADYPHVQQRLRKELRTAYAAAVSERRLPNTQEITSSSIPYLDAVMEEAFRVGSSAPIGSREAIRDTVLLGHRIPKGTVVMFLNKGPGFLSPSHTVDEELRSESSQQDKKSGHVREWDEEDIDQFKPERWLVSSDKVGAGEDDVAFDGNAGPTNTFGLGLRGCFGRRLANLEFKMILTLMLWSFELQKCPDELSGYDGRLKVVYLPRSCYVRVKKVDISIDEC